MRIETERLIISEMTMDMAMDVHKNSLERSLSEFSNKIKKCKFLLRGICLFLSLL